MMELKTLEAGKTYLVNYSDIFYDKKGDNHIFQIFVIAETK